MLKSPHYKVIIASLIEEDKYSTYDLIAMEDFIRNNRYNMEELNTFGISIADFEDDIKKIFYELYKSKCIQLEKVKIPFKLQKILNTVEDFNVNKAIEEKDKK